MRIYGYFPNGLLNEEQRKAKNEAIAETVEYTNAKNDKAYIEAIKRKDDATVKIILQNAAKAAGYSSDNGWRMDHTAPNSADGYSNSMDQIDKSYNSDGSIYSPKATYYYGEGRSYDKKAISVIQSARSNPEKLITVYRAVPSNVKESRMRNGDWVAIVKEYAAEHGERMFDGDYRIIESTVPAKELFSNGDSINEWGYDNGNSNEVYKNTESNVKLLEPTYDDRGQLIPLSKRFDEGKNDARYSRELDFIDYINEEADLYEHINESEEEIAGSKSELRAIMASEKRLQSRLRIANDVKGFDVNNADSVNAELVADIVGDYLFTDSKFINDLSVQKPKLFKKIWNEIKYFVKSVTVNTPEAKELVKLEKAFQKAYEESVKIENEENIKYSISKTSKMPYDQQLQLIENGQMNGSNSLYIGIPSASLQDSGLSNAPLAMNQSDYRKSRREAGNNKNYSSHAVPFAFFKNMPQYFGNAPMIIDNGDKATIITSYTMKDTKGNDSFVIGGIHKNQIMDNDTVNLVRSVYPWDDFSDRIKKAAESGNLIITNKNKAEQMLATIGIQPSELSNIISLAKNIISQNSDNVNRKNSLSDDGLGDLPIRGDLRIYKQKGSGYASSRHE